MTGKRFDCLHDFVRHGMNIELRCRNGHCDHAGIVGSYDTCTYFRLHRWSDALDRFMGQSALDRFRCTRCGDKAGSARPTEKPATVDRFFPADDRGWKMLMRRLRG